MIHYVRLPLEGTTNTRDLGGYSTKDGYSTKWQVFLRSDELVLISDQDKKFLEDYGLKTIIDLRSAMELSARPNPYLNHEQIQYHNVSLFEKADPKSLATLTLDSLGGMYVEMLINHKNQIKTVMEIIAEAPEGSILFHCAAGKDRTGVIAMLLLGLAKVRNRDIVSNYEVSHTNLKRNAYFKENKDTLSHLMGSTNTNMEDTLRYLYEHYPSIEAYLLDIGCTQEMLDKIKARFVLKAQT